MAMIVVLSATGAFPVFGPTANNFRLLKEVAESLGANNHQIVVVNDDRPVVNPLRLDAAILLASVIAPADRDYSGFPLRRGIEYALHERRRDLVPILREQRLGKGRKNSDSRGRHKKVRFHRKVLP